MYFCGSTTLSSVKNYDLDFRILLTAKRAIYTTLKLACSASLRRAQIRAVTRYPLLGYNPGMPGYL